jgi:two-component system, LytTR family, response regulator
MLQITSVIIDDETYNRDLIANFVVTTNPNFTIIGSADGVDTGYTLIKELQPDLVFLDIKMIDGSGFDLLNKFENPTFEVVFVTGFDDYAIKAFEYNALNYILKPIDTSKLKKVLEQVEIDITKNKLFKNAQTDDLHELILKTHDLGKISIHVNDKVVLLSITDITSVESQDRVTVFFDKKNNKYLSSKKIVDYDAVFEKLPHFIRIHKSTYINSDYIYNYTKGDICIITLLNGKNFEVSRRKKSEILRILSLK